MLTTRQVVMSISSERVILHSDMNSFYASVEMMLEPSLRGKPVAVCGSTESRHGIVLAKSIPAKKAGVKTGMVNWEALQACPDLIIVPPQYEQYMKYSKFAHEIYCRYTDLVEPFGMDECWLDISQSGTYGTGMEIAEKIRQSVKDELGLTVSIGVSFNKIFAKLGSDLKKPDAITEISSEDFREKIWPLDASELIYVGRATTAKLAKYGIHTIGELANTPPEYLQQWFGINGLKLWHFANGTDMSRVMQKDFASRESIENISRRIVRAYKKLPDVQDAEFLYVDPRKLVNCLLGLTLDFCHLLVSLAQVNSARCSLRSIPLSAATAFIKIAISSGVQSRRR